MTDDRRPIPPLRSEASSSGASSSGASSSGASSSGPNSAGPGEIPTVADPVTARQATQPAAGGSPDPALRPASPATGAPATGAKVGREPSTRDIMRMLERLSVRLDHVEARIETIAPRRPSAGQPGSQPGGVPQPDRTRPDRQQKPPMQPAPDPVAIPPRITTSVVSVAPRRAIAPNAGGKGQPRTLMTGRSTTPPVAAGMRPADPDIISLSAPLPTDGSDDHFDAPRVAGGAARHRPAAANGGSKARAAAPLLLLAALICGGVWLAYDRPNASEISDMALTQIDKLLYGPAADTDEDQNAFIEGRADQQALSDTQTASPVSALAVNDRWPGRPVDASARAEASQAPPDAPVVQAAPREGVDTTTLPDAAEERIRAADLPEDAPAALQDLARRAAAGNADAQHDLATEFALARTIPQDLERAAYWYRLSSDAGIVNATYNLGVLTRDGLGRDPSDEEAAALFSRAAARDHPDAQLAYGRMMLEGRGVARDPVQAAAWFQAASANGDPRGALELGQLFEAGLDGAPDISTAAGWYRIAADAGNETAEDALERLVGVAAPTPVPPQSAPSSEDVPEPVAPRDTSAVNDTVSIRQVQTLLTDLGYDPGPADGVMGDMTRNAIEAFQLEFSLPVTGAASGGLIEDLEHAVSLDRP